MLYRRNCGLIAAALLAAGFNASSAAYEPPPAFSITKLSLPANDIAYDPFSRLLWTTVPSRAGVGRGNTLTAIDPFSRSIGPSYFVGSEPNAIALSDDGRYAYAGLDGSNSAKRFNLASRSVDLTIPLGVEPFSGPYFVEDIAVMPGSAETIAISRKNIGFSPRHEGVVIYDGTVLRPASTPDHTGSNRIAFGATPNVLYGFNNESTDFGLRTMQVAAGGVSIVKTTENLITGFGTDIEFDGGRVYSSNGRTVQPASDLIVGTYILDCGFFGCNAAVEPFSSLGATFFVTSDPFGGGTLRVFEQDTFVPAKNYAIPDMEGDVKTLVKWGADGLAFVTTADEVFLLSPVPEPATSAMLLAGLGVIGMVIAKRRRIAASV